VNVDVLQINDAIAEDVKVDGELERRGRQVVVVGYPVSDEVVVRHSNVHCTHKIQYKSYSVFLMCTAIDIITLILLYWKQHITRYFNV